MTGARRYGFEFSTRVAAPAAEVWAHATCMRGVNRELFPLARMTHPHEFSVLDPERVPLEDSARAADLVLGADELAILAAAAPPGATARARYGEYFMDMLDREEG